MHWINTYFLRLQPWRKKLKRYFYAPQEEIFKHFRNGIIYFSFGCIVIYLANSVVEPSVKQELITLFGLVFCGFGFIYGMLSYLRFVFSRILFFFKQK